MVGHCVGDVSRYHRDRLLAPLKHALKRRLGVGQREVALGELQ